MKLLVVFGTRPEAIKLWPLVLGMRRDSKIEVHTLCTRQHPQLLDELLPILDWVPDTDLKAPPEEDMGERLGSLIRGVQDAADQLSFQPDAVLVQGDTFSTLAGAMMAGYRKVPVIHLEAGLRTYDIAHPFPEELHRQTLGRLASLHLAPTVQAQNNLLQEGCCEEDVVVTGNTVVDALNMMRERARAPEGFEGIGLSEYCLVTLHRREHAGSLSLQIAEGLMEAQKELQIPLVVVRHPNSDVSRPFCEALEKHEAVHVLPPTTYPEMLWLIEKARVVVTDSGGLQEEATTLGTPVGIVRRVTDRAEALESGAAKLLGIEAQGVCDGLISMLNNSTSNRWMSQSTQVFGDGHATERAIKAILERFQS